MSENRSAIFEERSRALAQAVEELADLHARLKAHLAQAALPADVEVCTCNEPGSLAGVAGDRAPWCPVRGGAR